MAETVKAGATPTLETFFVGVDEMRVHLDRKLQDPKRRRGRLANVVAQLLKPRDARELGRWLLSELADAIGASGAALIVRESGGAPAAWHMLGTPAADPRTFVDELWARAHTARRPLAAGEDTLAPLIGTERALGVLWFRTRVPLDTEAIELLAAIADTAGVALEQGLLLESIG